MTNVRGWQRRFAGLATATAVGLLALAPNTPALAERQQNPVAVFAALDKVTARISRLEIPIDQTVEFGALRITPRICNSRLPTEPPKTTSFVEVNEVQLDNTERRIFTGWMFAESPGLHAVQHPVFDVWLTECATALSPVARTDAATTITELIQETGMPLPVRKPRRTDQPALTRRRRSVR